MVRILLKNYAVAIIYNNPEDGRPQGWKIRTAVHILKIITLKTVALAF